MYNSVYMENVICVFNLACDPRQ